jgi:hypothetical protein
LRILSGFLIVIAGLLWIAPLAGQGATPTPAFYLPTTAELPPGLELQETHGPSSLGELGDLQEQRLYTARLPPAVLGVTVATGADPGDALQRYASSLSGLLDQGFTISRPNPYQDGTIDVELANPGEALSQRTRILVCGNVITLVRATSRNAEVTPEASSALVESIAAPVLAKMRARPVGQPGYPARLVTPWGA